MAAQLVTIYWRDIPAQITAQQGRTREKALLDARFQHAIDRAAMIAGIIQLPGRYNPYLNYSKSLRRSHLVLDRMLANEFITGEQLIEATANPPRLEEYSARLETRYPAGHFVEEVRRWFLDNPAFGASRGVRERLLFEGGLRIETTVDLDLQRAAETAVEAYLPANQGHPDAAVVVLETGTGQVLAMVGGRDFFATDSDAKVNLAVGSGRQVGSSMKPVALAAALEAGWQATSTYLAPNVLEFEIAGADEGRAGVEARECLVRVRVRVRARVRVKSRGPGRPDEEGR